MINNYYNYYNLIDKVIEKAVKDNQQLHQDKETLKKETYRQMKLLNRHWKLKLLEEIEKLYTAASERI